MKNLPITRLDRSPQLHDHLLRYCRLERGDIWKDPKGVHRVGCLDAANLSDVQRLLDGDSSTLAVQDPPYNMVAFEQQALHEYIGWCKRWVTNTAVILGENSSFYVWIGADQTCGFQPLPDFMVMMRETPFRSRSFITMRNQRGYGTQRNWMAVRQELLYYILGNPIYNVECEYTDIPKILRGYYKDVGGRKTENIERSGSENIRAGNVWVDIQQVFYRLVENVNGCYAQKPLKSAERIVGASSMRGDVVVDFFAHSGSTLLACEILARRCYTMDKDPVYCEIAIRRLEHFRRTGMKGWQNSNAFEPEIAQDSALQELVGHDAQVAEGSQATLF